MPDDVLEFTANNEQQRIDLGNFLQDLLQRIEQLEYEVRQLQKK